jgi:prevent-host-death family protein
MSDIALFEVKNRLSELVHRVEAGEEIGITRHGKVVARLVAPAHEDGQRRARDAISDLREARKGVSLGRLKSRDLVREGQR